MRDHGLISTKIDVNLAFCPYGRAKGREPKGRHGMIRSTLFARDLQ
jgi:hypothetical protein